MHLRCSVQLLFEPWLINDVTQNIMIIETCNVNLSPNVNYNIDYTSKTVPGR